MLFKSNEGGAVVCSLCCPSALCLIRHHKQAGANFRTRAAQTHLRRYPFTTKAWASQSTAAHHLPHYHHQSLARFPLSRTSPHLPPPVTQIDATAFLTQEPTREDRTCVGTSLEDRKLILFSKILDIVLTHFKRNVVQQLSAITNRILLELRESTATELNRFDEFVCIYFLLELIRC